MSNSVTYDKLKQIGEEIAQITDPRKFGIRLKHEFMATINDHPELQKEFARRSNFYENLRLSIQFKEQVDSIHLAFKKLKGEIIEGKLPATVGIRSLMRIDPDDEKGGLSLREFYQMLGTHKHWPVFDVPLEEIGVYISSKDRPPWNAEIGQYLLIRSFFSEARKAKALRNEESAMKVVDEAISLIEELRAMLIEPLIKEHLHAFYEVKYYSRIGENLPSIGNLSESVVRVCSELLLYLKMTEEQRKSGKKNTRFIKSIRKGIIVTTTGKELPFKMKNVKTSTLCEKVYTDCRQVGVTVRIDLIYNEVWKDDYESDSLGNWKTVYDTVRNVNKWAKKHGLPKLLECTKVFIERLA